MKCNISVIIPNYNRDELLLRAVKSAWFQTKRPDEIIIVDDCSDVDIEKFINDNISIPIIKIFKNDSRKGAAESRNIGVEYSQGKYISFLDSDDYWDEKKIEKQFNLIIKKKDLGLVYCDQWVLNKNGELVDSEKKLISNNLWEYLLKGWTAPNTSTLFFRKDSFISVGGFDSQLSSCQDHDLWMKVAKKGISVEPVKEKLSFFTRDADHRISANFSERIHGAELFLKKWKEQIVKSKGVKAYEEFRNDYINKTSYPFFVNKIKNGEYKTAYQIFKKYLIFNYRFYEETFIKLIKHITL